MAIPVSSVNPLPPPVAPAVNLPSTAPAGLFQATLANAEALQAQNQTPNLLTVLQDTGQLASVFQSDYPPATTITTAATNPNNPASGAPSPSNPTTSASNPASASSSNAASGLNGTGIPVPNLIQQNIAALAIPISEATSTTTEADTTANEASNLAEQLRLQIAGSTRSGTSEVGTTTTQSTASKQAPTTPAVPATPTSPTNTTATQTDTANLAVAIPNTGNATTTSAINPNAIAVQAAQNQVIPAQVPIVTGMTETTANLTQSSPGTPEPVPATVATAALPSAQTGERPVLAGDRLAVIAQEGANLQSAQVQKSPNFQTVLDQAGPLANSTSSPATFSTPSAATATAQTAGTPAGSNPIVAVTANASLTSVNTVAPPSNAVTLPPTSANTVAPTNNAVAPSPTSASTIAPPSNTVTPSPTSASTIAPPSNTVTPATTVASAAVLSATTSLHTVAPPTTTPTPSTTAANTATLPTTTSVTTVAPPTQTVTPTKSVSSSPNVGTEPTASAPASFLNVIGSVQVEGSQARAGISNVVAGTNAAPSPAKTGSPSTSDNSTLATNFSAASSAATSSASAATGTTSTSSTIPSLATQVADGVISHSQALNQNDTTEFRLRVTQSDLGPVNIQLISTGDEVRGHVVVASDSARQLLESQLPELRQKLESAGLSVQNFSVSTDSSGSGTSSGSAWQNQTSGTPSPYQAPVSTSASTAASRFRSSAISNGSQVDVVV